MRSLGQRMGAQEHVAVGADAQVLGLQHLEEVEQALRRLLQRGEVGHRRLIGRLSWPRLNLRRPRCADRGPAGHERHARGSGAPATAAAAPSRAPAMVLTPASSCACSDPAQMAAGDVAGLVRDHAGQLVRVWWCG